MFDAFLLREAGVLALDDDAGTVRDIEWILGADDNALADVVLDFRDAEVLVEGAGEGVRVGEALVQGALKEGFGV